MGKVWSLTKNPTWLRKDYWKAPNQHGLKSHRYCSLSVWPAFSEPQFPHLYNQDKKAYLPWFAVKLRIMY